MHLLFNSDVLYRKFVVRHSFGPAIERLMTVCQRQGVSVWIPETTLKEFESKQLLFAIEERNKLRAARSTLTAAAVFVDEFDADELIPLPDLVELLSASGANVQILRPTFEAFSDAHDRACYHRPPDFPANLDGNKKSRDEMRDLVIWAQALEVARRNGGGILVSKDKVHLNGRDLEEAEDAGLVVFETAESAVGWLDEQSFPFLRLVARRLLEVATPHLAALPEDATVSTIEVGDVRLGGDEYVAQISFDFTACRNAEEVCRVSANAVFVDGTNADVTVGLVGTPTSFGPTRVEGLPEFSLEALLEQGEIE